MQLLGKLSKEDRSQMDLFLKDHVERKYTSFIMLLLNFTTYDYKKL